MECTVAGLTVSPGRLVRGGVRRSLRHGRTFRRMLAEMEARERWSVNQLRAYQEDRLRELLVTCARHVPYYVDLFRREGLDPERLAPWELMTRIPPLEKSEVRRDPERFRNRALHRRLLHKAYTGGTTGTPLICWRDLHAINFENATIWRQRRWAGFGFDDRRVTLRGDLLVPTSRMSPPYWQYDAAERQLMMSSYHLGPRTAPDYAAALAAFKPLAVEGYPSSVALLARSLRETGVESFPVRAIFTSSETLLDSQREIVTEVFQAPFFDHYGNAERTAAICSCEQGRYHVLPDYAIVEFLEGGEIVGTPLFNHAFPLIRYRSGDTAVPQQEGGDCPCGRAAFPVVKQIQGRLESYVVTPEGRLVGRLDHIFKGVKHIAESQIVQESVGRVVLKVVRDVDYAPLDEALLVRHARERLGPAMEIAVEHVERIPRTAHGKFVAVVGLEEPGVERNE